MGKTKKAPAKKVDKKPIPKAPKKEEVKLKPVDKRFQMTVEGITMTIYSRKAGNPMTVERMKELIGWKVVDKDEEDDYLFSFKGEKIKLERNPSNRPFRPGFAKRYMNEMLRGKWRLNGETMIIDENDDAQSMQHRGVALIWAEWERKNNSDMWKHIWGNNPITIDCIVVQGISSEPDVLDTIDLGQKRSLGDVLYRDSAFSERDMSKKMRQKVTNTLSSAIRLVWIRSGGKSVSSAPHFPHSEALDFLNQNPKIVDSVDKIFELENGTGQNGCKVSRFLSLAYASALHYLMATSGTDQDEWAKDGSLDFSMAEKADDFWGHVASGANLKETDPIHVLREMMPKISGSTGFARDELVSMIVKAFNLWADGKKAKPNDIKVKKKTDDLNKPKLAEWPRLGGIDVEDPTIPMGDEAVREDIQELDTDLKGEKEGDDWAVGDRAWVRDQADGDHWFGTIDEINGPTITLTDHLTGKQWDEDIKNLQLDYPG